MDVTINKYFIITFAIVPAVSYANRASTSVEMRPGTSVDNALPTLTSACNQELVSHPVHLNIAIL
jgi:hypothetical protein